MTDGIPPDSVDGQWTPPSAPGSPIHGNGYDPLTTIERRMLEHGKAEHRQTTIAARRALKVAEETVDIGGATLVEVHRQGEQLDALDRNFETIQEEVKEASRLLKFMRRCCCFATLCCCDCFDPDLQVDRTRKARVLARREEHATQTETALQRLETKREMVSWMAKKDDPAYSGNEEAARSELMTFAQQARLRREAKKATDIGLDLPEDDRMEIQTETRTQDDVINKIDTAVGTLKLMSIEIHEELSRQDQHIDSIGDKAEQSHLQVGTLAKAAGRI